MSATLQLADQDRVPIEKMLGLTNFDHLPLTVARRLRANDEQVLATGQAHEFLEVIPV